MFPDFPKTKRYARQQLTRWVQHQVPALTPILGEVSHFRQHEGRIGTIVRSDDSKATMDYPVSEFQFELTKEEMRRLDLPSLRTKLADLAREIGAAESRQMFQRIGEAAEGVGNSLDAGGKFSPEHILEMIRRVRMDFDPRTMSPINQVFVMHPETARKIMPQLKEWERDPAFQAEHEKVMQKKREEWRAREASRKLVD